MRVFFSLTIMAGVCLIGYSTDLKTKSGAVFHNYEISGVNDKGIAILHDKGSTTITVEDWPDDKKEEIDKRFSKIKARQSKKEQLQQSQKNIIEDIMSNGDPVLITKNSLIGYGGINIKHKIKTMTTLVPGNRKYLLSSDGKIFQHGGNIISLQQYWGELEKERMARSKRMVELGESIEKNELKLEMANLAPRDYQITTTTHAGGGRSHSVTSRRSWQSEAAMRSANTNIADNKSELETLKEEYKKITEEQEQLLANFKDFLKKYPEFAKRYQASSK